MREHLQREDLTVAHASIVHGLWGMGNTPFRNPFGVRSFKIILSLHRLRVCCVGYAWGKANALLIDAPFSVPTSYQTLVRWLPQRQRGHTSLYLPAYKQA